MEYLFGVVLAGFVPAFATLVALDRDGALYPTAVAVIASYCGLFVVMGGSIHGLATVVPALIFFLAATVFGLRRNLWLVSAGVITHGVFDFVHGHGITRPCIPAWCPTLRLALDVAAAAYLCWLQQQSRVCAEET